VIDAPNVPARRSAKTLLGKGSPFLPVPYFWTDQFDAKIQAYGLPSREADFEIVAGNAADGKFAALYGIDGRVTAALSWNLPREARALRKHVFERTPWKEALGL
jgi:hypothetical protein